MHPNARYLSRAPRSKKAIKKDMRQGFILLLYCLAFFAGLGWAVGKFTSPASPTGTQRGERMLPRAAAATGPEYSTI